MTRMLATASALTLGAAGAVLLFAADEVMERSGAPGSFAAVVGQCLGGAWLALAFVTWLTRNTPQGGIYGRPIVLANTSVYTITALVCLRAFWVNQAVSVTALVAGAFALLYSYVLFRAPVDPGR